MGKGKQPVLCMMGRVVAHNSPAYLTSAKAPSMGELMAMIKAGEAEVSGDVENKTEKAKKKGGGKAAGAAGASGAVPTYDMGTGAMMKAG